MTRARDVANVLSTATALATDTETAAAISSHNSVTTSVHGITNTATLATQTYADSAVSTHAAAADPHTGYLLESLYDAKGDLIVGSANNVPSKLTSGNSGETLVADSSTSTGLRWQVPVNVNPVINASMQIAQRGTSFTASNAYTLDRWYKGAAPAATFTQQATSDTTNLAFIQKCIRIQRNSGSSATNAVDFGQNFETVNSIPYAGKTVTLSFYARAGANFSATSNTLTAQVYSGTGTDQSVFTGFTGQVTVLSSSVTLTTTWQRFTATATVGATATQLALYFQYSPTGTAGANDYYEITGIQLEVGSVATQFKTNAATLAGELAACKRYFERHSASSTLGYGPYAAGYANFATAGNFAFKYETEKRAQPTITFGPSVGQFMAGYRGNGGVGAVTLTAGNITRFGSQVTLVPSGTPFTQGDGMLLSDAGSAVSYIDISAEF